MRTICVIPAWNEEKNIGRVLERVKSYVNEIVVVDDGSADNTFQEIKKYNVHALRHIINRGQGAALQTGNEYALQIGADIVVHFDADGQFLAEEIEEVITPVKNGEFDVVFGSRFMGKESNIPKFKKNIIVPLGHLVNKIIIGKSLTDPQSGFRVLSKKAVKTIIIEQNEMAHCSEIIHKTFKNNLKYKEVPITVIYNDFGRSFGTGIKIVKDLLLAKVMD